MMAILNIEPVTLSGMRIMGFLYGLPGTGKTLSALRLAAGLEPDPAKRGLIDTEGGQRGRMYSDRIEGGYLYGCLRPPFTPERYIEAISEFEKAGVSVLVIDSVSHVWNSIGGVLDMVDESTVRNDMAKWKGPKRRLAKLTQKILHSDCHIIMSARAKKSFVEVPNPERPGKTMYVDGPVKPIIEKTLPYDMLVIAHMLGDGAFTVEPPAGKSPVDMRAIFSRHEVMTEETGEALRSWIGSIRHMTPAQRQLYDQAVAEAGIGSAAFAAWASTLAEPDKVFLRRHWDDLKSVARAADVEEERNNEEMDRADEEGPALASGIESVS